MNILIKLTTICNFRMKDHKTDDKLSNSQETNINSLKGTFKLNGIKKYKIIVDKLNTKNILTKMIGLFFKIVGLVLNKICGIVFLLDIYFLYLFKTDK
jgi:hypothetical protein